MKKLLIIITLAMVFPLSGCASFRQMDTTDVIPNQSQINAQLSAEKAKEKNYNTTKGTYPETIMKPVTTPTTTITPAQTTTAATTQPVKPVQIAETPSTTPAAVVTPVSSATTVTISSGTKKPIREIIIYPDDTPTQDVTVKPGSGTQVIKVTPTASKTPVVTTPNTVATEAIYKVLVGKFPTKDAVEPLLAELKETYKEAFIKKNEAKEEYSVQIAASTNEKAVNDLVTKLKEKGYKVFVLTVKK